MSCRLTLKPGDVLLAGLFLWCSLPIAGAADGQVPSNPSFSAASAPTATSESTYYNTVLSGRDYSGFGITGNGGVVRPYVTAFYYPWYHRNGTDRQAPWGTVTREQIPSPLTDNVYPWLIAGASRVFQAPVIGFYNDGLDHIMDMHLNWAQNAGLDALLVSDAGSQNSVLAAMKRLNSSVKFIPVLEYAVTSGRDSANMEHVKADLVVKFNGLVDLRKLYPNNFLAYGGKPVVYIYSRALMRVWPKGKNPTKEEKRQSAAAYRDAYAKALLQLRGEGKEFITVADQSISTEGITDSTLDAPGHYSTNQYFSQWIAPACQVFDGFLPYHKIFRLDQTVTAPSILASQAKVDEMQQDLQNDYATAKNYLNGSGVLQFENGRLTVTRPTNKKICGITVMPGFQKSDGPGFKIDRAEGKIYTAFWKAAINAFPPSQSFPGIVAITSFNEHFEGSGIEPTVGTGSKYLDLTLKNALAFKYQPPNKLQRDIYGDTAGSLKMIRWGYAKPNDLPRDPRNTHSVDLTTVMTELYGKTWVFDEATAKTNFDNVVPAVPAKLNPRVDGEVTIKAGLNNWDAGILLQKLTGSTIPQQTITVRRRIGSDVRLGIRPAGVPLENADISVTGVTYDWDKWLFFHATGTDPYRAGQAVFDVKYSVNSTYSTAITVRFVPFDDRINLASGEHIRPDQDGGVNWNGEKNKAWYHRLDGRKRIEAVYGTHHLVIFLTGTPQAILDGRCIKLPRLPSEANGHWFVPEEVFSPLLPIPAGRG